MTRSVPLWQGETPDTRPPTRVRIRVFDREQGRCHKCTRKIQAGETWTLEHIQALVNGGSNSEDNLGVTCANCLPEKNAADVRQKSEDRRRREKHLGLRKSKSVIPGSKASPWKRKMDGTVVRRDGVAK